jgi:AraC-like DNA-binding protein/quercetin dioxygenase-like cupin family protein
MLVMFAEFHGVVLRSSAVTVSARSANIPPATDTIRFSDLRTCPNIAAGTFAFDSGNEVVTGWHVHDLHQIEYAFEGTVEVETDAAHYLLSPQQAIWMPAGLAHCTTLHRVRTVSVFFSPEMVAGGGGRARVLAAVPVVREMILYATRWPIGRPESDATADAFFDVLGRLAREWLDHEVPLSLPTSNDPIIAAVMAETNRHLADVTAETVCNAVGLSTRTLRRRFHATTGITWQRYVHQSRLLRAMAALAEPGPSIIDVATTVGFASASAFTRAFTAFTGESPSAYRSRCRQ